MAQNSYQSEDFKSQRRQVFLRRMEAKLRMKEAMHEHDRGHSRRFSDFR